MNIPITCFCSWCSQPLLRKGTYKTHSKKEYISCSSSCQKKLSSAFQSKEWLLLPEKERIKIGRWGIRDWYENQEENSMLKAKKYLEAVKPSQITKAKKHVPKKASTIYKAHNEAMKDDPECLTEQFMEKLIGKRSPS